MPSVDFSACLSNYWFVWTINSLGSIFGLAVNMAISFFFLKYFHSMAPKPSAPSKPSAPPKPSAPSFDSIHKPSPPRGKKY